MKFRCNIIICVVCPVNGHWCYDICLLKLRNKEIYSPVQNILGFWKGDFGKSITYFKLIMVRNWHQMEAGKINVGQENTYWCMKNNTWQFEVVFDRYACDFYNIQLLIFIYTLTLTQTLHILFCILLSAFIARSCIFGWIRVRIQLLLNCTVLLTSAVAGAYAWSPVIHTIPQQL